jgi:hypothetical protein
MPTFPAAAGLRKKKGEVSGKNTTKTDIIRAVSITRLRRSYCCQQHDCSRDTDMKSFVSDVVTVAVMA